MNIDTESRCCYNCGAIDKYDKWYNFILDEDTLPSGYHKYLDQLIINDIDICFDCFDEFNDWYNEQNRFCEWLVENFAPIGVWLNLFPHENKRTLSFDHFRGEKRVKI